MANERKNRFNVELLRSHLETAKMSQRGAGGFGVWAARHGPELAVRGGVCGAENLRKLGDAPAMEYIKKRAISLNSLNSARFAHFLRDEWAIKEKNTPLVTIG